MTNKLPSMGQAKAFLFVAFLIVIIGSVVIFFVGLLLSLIIPVAIVFTVLWVIWLITREVADLEPKTDDD